MHVKRTEMPTTWPMVRKGTTFIAKPRHSNESGIPLLFILREIMKIATTRKEARQIVLAGNVKVNQKVRKDEMFTVQIFDTITIEGLKKNYRLEIVNRKFKLVEISDKEANHKIVRISGKVILAKGKVQMNLEDCHNFITNDKFSVGDSVVLNLKETKVEKILPRKVGAKVEIISGKHAGSNGQIKEVQQVSRSKKFLIKLTSGEVALPEKTFMVVE